ncbi:GMC family oxidoreductase N-terminal domain-containing protein [Staphylococcus aureus]
MGGRKRAHARGKVLGGSSSINGMIYQRGNPMDYEGWVITRRYGNLGFCDCSPYFKKLEKTYGAAPYDKLEAMMDQ